tara:strand:- start:22323 stop:22577 length:255 start_codon:yes stop_codon:yes gene_type:complete
MDIGALVTIAGGVVAGVATGLKIVYERKALLSYRVGNIRFPSAVGREELENYHDFVINGNPRGFRQMLFDDGWDEESAFSYSGC